MSLAGDASDLSLRLLGPIEVFRDAQRKIPASAWKIRRALQILCYLASSRSRRAGKERIIDALWDDARLSAVDKNFHPTISCLRRALNYGFAVPKNFVLFEGGAYLLNPAYRYGIDIEAFEEGIRAARRKAAAGKIAGALADYDTAIALYRGSFLEDDYAEWTEAPRAHFESLRLRALAEAGRLHLGSGHREAGIACLSTLVEGEPLNEEASALLMTSFGNFGNRAAVEREFARVCRALKKELSSEPLPETRRAYLEALSPRRVAGRAKKTEPQSGRMGVVISIARAKRGSIP